MLAEFPTCQVACYPMGLLLISLKSKSGQFAEHFKHTYPKFMVQFQVATFGQLPQKENEKGKSKKTPQKNFKMQLHY